MRVCRRNPKHVETETVAAVKTQTSATCTAAGETIWKAEFGNAAFAPQTKTEKTEALGHSWSKVKYTWSKDNTKVTASRICANDPAHKEEETVTAAYTEITKATCETAGKGTWKSAAFTNPAFAVQTKSLTSPAAGHSWDAGVVTKEATAEAAGVKTYTCSRCKKTRTETIPKLSGEAATKYAEGDPADPTSTAGSDKAAAAVSDKGEAKGSSFAAIQLQSKKQARNSVTLSWNIVKDTDGKAAAGYLIYGNLCGKNYQYARIAKQAKNSLKVTKLADGTKIAKGKYYKFYVAAYRIVDGKEKIIAASRAVHVAAKGGKALNVKKLKADKTKVTLAKKGQKHKIKLTTTLSGKKGKLANHRKIKYETSNKKVATVSAKGVIKAVKKGKCIIYAYSQTGTFAKITVTVKK